MGATLDPLPLRKGEEACDVTLIIVLVSESSRVVYREDNEGHLDPNREPVYRPRQRHQRWLAGADISAR